MTSSSEQAYCEFLGIPCPAIGDFICRNDVRPIQLFALTILIHGKAMTMGDVAGYLTSHGWIPATGDPILSLTKAWGGRLPIVQSENHQTANQLYDLDLTCIELRMRLFEIGIRTKIEKDTHRRSLGGLNSSDEHITPPKRLLVHGFQAEGQLVALSLLDMDERSLVTVYGDELKTVAQRLNDYPVIIGLEPRKLLANMGITDVLQWWLIDLAKHPRSKQINKRGRKLSITTEMLISSSTGISKPLGDPVKMQEYWRQEKRSMLSKRMESDAKALYAFYRYGALHNSIRLRWGFLSESYHVEWGVPGEPMLYSIVREKMEKGESIEFVRGSAPGWSDPWSRGKHAIVERLNAFDVVLSIDGSEESIPREDFQAVR
jgi:hypothetical protein